MACVQTEWYFWISLRLAFPTTAAKYTPTASTCIVALPTHTLCKLFHSNRLILANKSYVILAYLHRSTGNGAGLGGTRPCCSLGTGYGEPVDILVSVADKVSLSQSHKVTFGLGTHMLFIVYIISFNV